MTTYSDYSRDRIGWFFGISGWQLASLATGSLPIFWAVRRQAWSAGVLLTALWVVALVLVVVPVRGRSATGWLWALLAHAVGSLAGWTGFTSAAARGRSRRSDAPDLPGVLQGLEVHEGLPGGPELRRPAVVQDHAHRTWAVTAMVVHPGIGMQDAEGRHRYALGLSRMLDVAARTERVDEVLFVTRTVPEDGAERELWVDDHQRSDAPFLARRVTAELAAGLSRASVRTEQFVTIVVPESRVARSAREAGGGLEGRFRELQLLMGELESQLRGGLGMTSVTWLTSSALAVACRTGFAPGDRAGIVHALGEVAAGPGLVGRASGPSSDSSSSPGSGDGPGGSPGRGSISDAGRSGVVNADVPWAMAGPSGADAVMRHYSHDAWNSISVTVGLPAGGVAMGALAPVLTPGEVGERRSMVVSFPIIGAAAAERRSANTEWAAETAASMRSAVGMKTRARQRDQAAQAHGMDRRLAYGHAMLRPYAVCTVTVPKTYRVSEFGRRLDAAVRRCGLAPLRLDLCQDAAFAASTIPLGVGLTRRGSW